MIASPRQCLCSERLLDSSRILLCDLCDLISLSLSSVIILRQNILYITSSSRIRSFKPIQIFQQHLCLCFVKMLSNGSDLASIEWLAIVVEIRNTHLSKASLTSDNTSSLQATHYLRSMICPARV